LRSYYDVLISDLKEQIQDSDARTNKLQAKLREYESRIISLEDRVEKDQGAFDELREQKATAETEISKLNSTYNALISDLNRQIRDRDIQAAGLQGRLSDLKKEIQRLYTQAAELPERLSDLNRQSQEKDVQVAGLHEKISDLNRQAKETDVQTAWLQKRLKEYQSMISSLMEKVGDGQTEFKELRQYLSEIEGQKVTAETEIVQMKSTYDALISDLNRQIQKKEVTIRGFEEKLSISFVDRILFKSGRATITPEGKGVLKKVGDILKNVRKRNIRVVGHTDNIPLRQEYRDRYPTNWELSSARAAAVVRYFQWKSHIDPRNLEAAGSSFYHPIASNETEEGRARNRRVEIVITPKLDY